MCSIAIATFQEHFVLRFFGGLAATRIRMRMQKDDVALSVSATCPREYACWMFFSFFFCVFGNAGPEKSLAQPAWLLSSGVVWKIAPAQERGRDHQQPSWT